MKDLNKLEEKIIPETRAVLDTPEDLRDDAIKEYFGYTDEEEIKSVREFIENMPASKDYSWTKKELETVESNILTLSTSGEKEETQLNALKFIHDKVKGKAVNRTELTGAGGEKLQLIFDSNFNNTEDETS